ncbi:integral membrane protein 2B-like [Seriola lalandi dorsalis]|uniref:integral membrane protein 2B-like n=1 Tax=Seriola lalandi dorsalis TaxID=1841481 RepID=UPI000C6F7F98|nr:integral membrane protein 2B-like [Seriola lalandi dorsalis]
MPPRDFLELLINVKAGTYLPQSYLVHEEMIVTERLERVDQLGYFIYNLCRGKETFKLQRRDRILGKNITSSGPLFILVYIMSLM